MVRGKKEEKIVSRRDKGRKEETDINSKGERDRKCVCACV